MYSTRALAKVYELNTMKSLRNQTNWLQCSDNEANDSLGSKVMKLKSLSSRLVISAYDMYFLTMLTVFRESTLKTDVCFFDKKWRTPLNVLMWFGWELTPFSSNVTRV